MPPDEPRPPLPRPFRRSKRVLPRATRARSALLCLPHGAFPFPGGTHRAIRRFIPSEDARALPRRSLPGCTAITCFLEDRRGGRWPRGSARGSKLGFGRVCEDARRHPASAFGNPATDDRDFGFAPVASRPFALRTRSGAASTAVLEEGLLQEASQNFHPQLRNDATPSIAGKDLVRFLEACGHAPAVALCPSANQSVR